MAVDSVILDIRSFFKRQRKTVVTFVGYSNSEYEHPQALIRQAQKVLALHDRENTIINSGATAAGIGTIYRAAKQIGFITTGILSTQAKIQQADISPYVDHLWFIPDETWGGFLPGDAGLSPTSAITVEISDIMVGIGGGMIARDELIAATQLGKTVFFFPADMNHKKALERARQNGLPKPPPFEGAAARYFSKKA